MAVSSSQIERSKALRAQEEKALVDAREEVLSCISRAGYILGQITAERCGDRKEAGRTNVSNLDAASQWLRTASTAMRELRRCNRELARRKQQHERGVFQA